MDKVDKLIGRLTAANQKRKETFMPATPAESRIQSAADLQAMSIDRMGGLRAHWERTANTMRQYRYGLITEQEALDAVRGL